MNRNDYFGDTDKLLFDILCELKEINSKLGDTKHQGNKVNSELKSEIKVVPLSVPCKYCNGIHENKGQFLACSRKNKKEGAINVSAN